MTADLMCILYRLAYAEGSPVRQIILNYIYQISIKLRQFNAILYETSPYTFTSYRTLWIQSSSFISEQIL